MLEGRLVSHKITNIFAIMYLIRSQGKGKKKKKKKGNQIGFRHKENLGENKEEKEPLVSHPKAEKIPSPKFEHQMPIYPLLSLLY